MRKFRKAITTAVLLILVLLITACNAVNTGSESTKKDGSNSMKKNGNVQINENTNTQKEEYNYNSVVPKAPQQAKKVYVVRMGADYDEAVLAAGIQGLAAAKGDTQVYIIPNTGTGQYSMWLEVMKKDYGVEAENMNNVWGLLEKYKEDISGYILYDTKYERTKNTDSSINVATTLANQLNAVPVSKKIEDRVKQAGLNMVLDVTGWNEQLLLEKSEYLDKLNKNAVLEQWEWYSYHNRDYAIMSNMLTFFSPRKEGDREKFISLIKPNSPIFGWGDPELSEIGFVSRAAKKGLYTIGSDWALNMSTLSSFCQAKLEQKTKNEDIKAEQGKHYVCFMMTDGDNVQWWLGALNDARWFGNSNRGQFKMGWGVPPTLIDIAAPALKWYYDNASEKDGFIAQVSGMGYMYPSKLPEGVLDEHVVQLNEYMERSDLSIIQVCDTTKIDETNLWDKYTAQPNIDTLFYINYAGYSKCQGQIIWSNNKPVISARFDLWKDLPGGSNEEVIKAVNAMPKDPTSPEGYSLISVHCWTKTLTDVKQVMESFDENVVVVTPEEFAKLIKENVKR